MYGAEGTRGRDPTCRDPNGDLPLYALISFLHFRKDNRPILRRETPILSYRDIGKALGRVCADQPDDLPRRPDIHGGSVRIATNNAPRETCHHCVILLLRSHIQALFLINNEGAMGL